MGCENFGNRYRSVRGTERGYEMTDVPMVHYWMGRPLTDLTREELIEAVITLARAVDSERQLHMHTLDIFGTAGAMK